MIQVQAWKRSKDRWSPKETDVLIRTWAPLYLRCRRGTKDAWVPLHVRGRARRSSALVVEDWRAVAEAVNSYRVHTAGRDSRRTYLQCRKRVEYLKGQYMKGEAARSGWPFIGALHAVWADEVGDHGAGAQVEGRGGPTGDAAGTAAGTYDGTPAVDGFVPSGDERGTAMINALASAAAAAAAGSVPAGDARRGSAVEAPEGAAAAEDASRGSAVEAPDGAVVVEGAASAGDADGTASVAARGGAFVHEEDCRAAAVAVSCLTSDGISSERAQKRCRERRVKPLSDINEKKPAVVCAAAVDEEHGDVGDASDGALVDAAAEADPRRSTFVPPPIPKRPRSSAAKPAASSANMPAEATVTDLSAQALAAGSVDAAVVTNLAQIYKELRMKVFDAEREKAAAAHAGAGRRA